MQQRDRVVNDRAIGDAIARAGGLYAAVHFLVPPATPGALPGEARKEHFIAHFGEQALRDLVRLGYVQVGKPGIVPVYVTAHYTQFRKFDETEARIRALPNRIPFENIVALTWRAWLYVGRELPDPSWYREADSA